MMDAIEVVDGALALARRPVPVPSAGEVLIRVAAAGLNRGDLYQRDGAYPPPPGVTDIPGLEVAGTIVGYGPGVSEWAVGDGVCALLAGGGYAAYAIAPEGQCLPLPVGLSMAEAAALPEAVITCWATLVEQGRLAADETVLIHGGASGIGTPAIQLAKLLGARVIVTAGSDDKCDACRALGADVAINYRREDFVVAALAATEGSGCDLVLDMVAGEYVGRDMAAMAFRGRHVTIGTMGGVHASTIPMNVMLRNQLVLTASTLRGRSLTEKRELRDQVARHVWPWVLARRLQPVVHARYPLAAAAEAQRALETGNHFGKIVLTLENTAPGQESKS